MNQLRFLDRSPFRPIPRAVPVALLISAVALSLTTACFTYSGSTEAPPAPPSPAGTGPAGPNLSFLHRVHVEDPARAVEPGAIAGALAPVLPPPLPGGRQGGNQIEVTWVAGRPGKPEYRIEAYGDFTPESARTFIHFIQQLRRELPEKAWLVVFIYRDMPGPPHLVTWQAIE